MEFIDTHTHIYDETFDADREQTLQRAVDAGVTTMLLPAIDSQSTHRQLDIYNRYPQYFHLMAGLHPTSVTADFEPELSHTYQQLKTNKNIAIGEIGMDLYWDRTFQEQQTEVLRLQLQWAIGLDLPVVLHIRKAHNEVFSLLREFNRPSWKGVIHCFGGSVQEAQKALEMGFHLGIGGVVTFKNATMAELVKVAPLERILLETDSPYLSPVPHRGQRNESSYIPLIAHRIAELKEISIEQVAEVTTASAKTLFSL